MAQRKIVLSALLLALVGGVAYMNTPPALVNAAVAPQLPSDIEAWLADSEQQVASQYALIPETEKRVTWYGQPGERTAYVVVNLHGFSATRQETAPLAERVAKSLAASGRWMPCGLSIGSPMPPRRLRSARGWARRSS
jgi:hypothetical protein